MNHILENITSHINSMDVDKDVKKKCKKKSIKRLKKSVRSYHIQKTFHFIGFTSFFSAFLIIIDLGKFALISFLVIAIGNFVFTFFSRKIFLQFKKGLYITLTLLMVLWLLLNFLLVHYEFLGSPVHYIWVIIIKTLFTLSFIFPFIKFYRIHSNNIEGVINNLAFTKNPNPLDFYDDF